MTQRCTNKRNKDWHRYGGKGIKVCRRWRSYDLFMEDMKESFDKHLAAHGKANTTLDRIDNHLGYSPRNCRWATIGEQNRNKVDKRIISFSGVSMGLSKWATVLGISYQALAGRLANGWSVRAAFTTPLAKNARRKPV